MAGLLGCILAQLYGTATLFMSVNVQLHVVRYSINNQVLYFTVQHKKIANISYYTEAYITIRIKFKTLYIKSYKVDIAINLNNRICITSYD